MDVIYGLMINDHKILFISLFLYFIIVRKSIRTLRRDMILSNETRKFHLVAAKKGIPFYKYLTYLTAFLSTSIATGTNRFLCFMTYTYTFTSHLNSIFLGKAYP